MSGRRSLLSRLASVKLAATLIGTFVVLTVLSVLVPQRSFLGSEFDQFAAEYPTFASIAESLGLDHIFTSPIFMAILALLAINVSVCTFKRAQRHWRTPRGVSVPRGSISVPLAEEWQEDASSLVTRVAELLTHAGFRSRLVTADGVVAERGRIGFLGSLVLHVSLLILIAGGIATSLTTFRGQMVIADGQTVVDEPASYLAPPEEPQMGEAFTAARLSVDSSLISYEDGTLVDAVTSMRAVDSGGRIQSADVRVNHPFNVSGKSYLLQSSGYAVAFVLSEPGTSATPVVLNLAEETARGWADELVIPGSDGGALSFEMQATAVPLPDGEGAPVERLDLADPQLELVVRSGGEVVWAGPLAEGESAEFDSAAGSTRFTFEELRLWHRYLVRGEPARWVTYIGFWLATLGALVRFLIPERRIALVVGAGEAEGARRQVRLGLRSRPWTGFSAKSDEILIGKIAQLASQGTEASTAESVTLRNGDE